MLNENGASAARAPAAPLGLTPSYVDSFVRHPSFWKVELTTVQLEAQFDLAHITADQTKFDYVISAWTQKS